MDLDTHSIKLMLVTDAYVPDVDTHTVFADVTNEITGTGYTAGGEELQTPTVTQDDLGNQGVFDAEDVVWSGSSLTAKGAVLYDDTIAVPEKPLIAYIDFGANKTSLAGDFKVQWNSGGILTNT